MRSHSLLNLEKYLSPPPINQTDLDAKGGAGHVHILSRLILNFVGLFGTINYYLKHLVLSAHAVVLHEKCKSCGPVSCGLDLNNSNMQ